MSELVSKELSSESGVKLEWQDGKLRLELGYDGKGADAGLFVSVEAEYLIREIAEKIPGKVDDIILEGLLGALK